MANSVMFTLHMDRETKKKCEEIYGELGMTLSGAIHVFMRRSVHAGGFPFDVRLDVPTRDNVLAVTEEKKSVGKKKIEDEKETEGKK